ncbi:ABC transporter ATP-binding protein [Enterococcus faecium]|uniref:ABC transporter ATP-binding protein n=2 Tax=Lactobacillales TaxID=186826 RepID=UPI001CF905DE|nr:ABC transporter ATP-binding protein [Enterococcus faecium]MBZ3655277.1 ABC transporter ATP-binding protein [Enterococcus faecium]
MKGEHKMNREDAIVVTNLKKSYQRNKILKGLNLTIKKGEVYGLLGANGAGKSTTIESILGIKPKDEGTVRILNLNPISDRKELFKDVSVQFQQTSYPDKIKVKELCIETQCLYKEPLDYNHLLEQFDLLPKKDAYVKELSGGQQQRLFIVLALIPNPKVVFLDELTTGLDVKSRRLVWRSLNELKKKGLTIFLTSHFMDEVEALCDRIGILKDGTLIFEGTIEEAINQSNYQTLSEAYLWFVDEEELEYE